MGARLFRNNVGTLQDIRGQYVRYGLCIGSADLIGWLHGGRFLAVEVKRPGGKPTKEQAAFLAAVNASGGLGILARSVEDFTRGISGNSRTE